MSGEKLSSLPILTGSISSTDLVYVVRSGASFQANGSQIPSGIIVRQSKTVNYTVTASDAGTYFDNIGALAEVDFTLPTVPSAVQTNVFLVSAAQTVKIVAPTGVTISLGPTTTAAGGFVSCAEPGASVMLYALTATHWVSLSLAGSWSVN